jgi:hypothetical protein
MNRPWKRVALCGFALAGLGAATAALAVEPSELAAIGTCATELRELQLEPVSSAADAGERGDGSSVSGGSNGLPNLAGGPNSGTRVPGGGTPSASPSSGSPNTPGGGGTTATGSPRVHLTPIQVAASPIPFSGPRPLPQVFPGPGACDQPGSGCQGQVLPAAAPPVFVDPSPTGGCNFPGCVVP